MKKNRARLVLFALFDILLIAGIVYYLRYSSVLKRNTAPASAGSAESVGSAVLTGQEYGTDGAGNAVLTGQEYDGAGNTVTASSQQAAGGMAADVYGQIASGSDTPGTAQAAGLTESELNILDQALAKLNEIAKEDGSKAELTAAELEVLQHTSAVISSGVPGADSAAEDSVSAWREDVLPAGDISEEQGQNGALTAEDISEEQGQNGALTAGDISEEQRSADAFSAAEDISVAGLLADMEAEETFSKTELMAAAEEPVSYEDLPPTKRCYLDGSFWEGCPERDIQLLTPNPYSRPQYALEEVHDIVIHYVGNPNTTAQQNRDYFESLKDGSRSASSHFVVGLEGEIIQCISCSEWCYASNQRNYDTIAIEVCHPDETGKFNDSTYRSVVDLTAWLCKAFEIGPKHVIRHYDVTGKKCPKYYVEHEDAWEQMLADIEESYNKLA